MIQKVTNILDLMPTKKKEQHKTMVKAEIIKMGIRSEQGWVFFNELLYRSMRRVYGKIVNQSHEMKQIELKA